jgi:hypothetical protein
MQLINYEDLQIDTTIPLPSGGQRRGSGLAHLLRKLAYGESVFIPFREGAKPSSLSSNCHTASRAAGVRLTIRKWQQCESCLKPRDEFINAQNLTGVEPCECRPIRRVMPNVQLGVRVWRVDGQAHGSAKESKNGNAKNPGAPRKGRGPRL